MGGVSGPEELARAACLRAQNLPALPTVVTHAEQFGMDVSVIDDAMRRDLGQALGEESVGFVWRCYVADMTPRVRMALEGLFRPDPEGWTDGSPDVRSSSAESVRAAAMEFSRLVHNLHELDPVTTELVRLRGARQHNCRMCKSLRSRASLSAGAEESMFDAIDHHADSDLPPHQKAALALTDAMIWQPTSLPGPVLDEVRSRFMPAQATEIVLDVMRNAMNKVSVALGTDGARVDEGFEVYEIDQEGIMHFGT